VSIALQYLDAWLGGNGAAAINNLMEDAATAEISRSQLWQWRTSGARLDDGREASADLYRAVRDEEVARLGAGAGHLGAAADLLDRLVLDDEFADFLTQRAYSLLD
jgi:malate synthase